MRALIILLILAAPASAEIVGYRRIGYREIIIVEKRGPKITRYPKSLYWNPPQRRESYYVEPRYVEPIIIENPYVD